MLPGETAEIPANDPRTPHLDRLPFPRITPRQLLPQVFLRDSFGTEVTEVVPLTLLSPDASYLHNPSSRPYPASAPGVHSPPRNTAAAHPRYPRRSGWERRTTARVQAGGFAALLGMLMREVGVERTRGLHQHQNRDRDRGRGVCPTRARGQVRRPPRREAEAEVGGPPGPHREDGRSLVRGMKLGMGKEGERHIDG
jgi:hypothetical protein